MSHISYILYGFVPLIDEGFYHPSKLGGKLDGGGVFPFIGVTGLL